MKIHHNEWPWGWAETWIAFDGAGIFRLSVTKEEPDTIYLSDVSVQKRHRGKGYGRSLLRMATHRAKQTDCSRMKLHVYPRGFAMSWYKRNGFQTNGVITEDGAIEMEKNLCEEDTQRQKI